MTQDQPASKPTFADKLDRLFRTVKAAPNREYSYEEVSDAIVQRGVTSISHTYVWQLRKGIKGNPSIGVVGAISDFFGVPPSYFFDEEQTRQVESQLELLDALRDTRVRGLAIRASDLSKESLEAVMAMVERMRQLEGIPDGPEEGERQVRHRRPKGERAKAKQIREAGGESDDQGVVD